MGLRIRLTALVLVLAGVSAGLGVGPDRADAAVCDALCDRVISELAVFADWLRSNGERGYVGEVGWPDDALGDAAAWNAVAQEWFDDADAAGLDVTVWATGHWWPSDYRLLAYHGLAQRTQAPVIESHPSTASYGRGVNVAGAEFGAPIMDRRSRFSNRRPGSYGTAYTYEPTTSFTYLASRGVKVIRLPFRWERLQRKPGGALNAAELARLRGAVQRADAAGLQTILDPHNFGQYYLWNRKAKKGIRTPIGSRKVRGSHFVDLWRRLSAAFVANPGIYAYALMNEPVNLGRSGARRWEAYSQAALRAIRARGDDTLVMVPGYEWSGAQRWSTTHPDPWITDPADNFAYEAHHYWDRDNSGDYPDTYASEVANAASRGYGGP